MSKDDTITVSKTWRERAVEWLFAQGVSTVLLVLHTAVVCYFAWYALGYAIPDHLKAIQDGYERMEASHAAERQRAAAENAETVKYFVDSLRQMQLERGRP